MRIHATRQGMSKERAANMMHTFALIECTVECALLLVTWMTRPLSSLPVTATRRVPSGDHATSINLALMWCQNKEGQTNTYIIITPHSVHPCPRGNIGDTECLVMTASRHQSAVGGNRTRIHLQTQSASDQQHIKSKERRTLYVCSPIVAFLTN